MKVITVYHNSVDTTCKDSLLRNSKMELKVLICKEFYLVSVSSVLFSVFRCFPVFFAVFQSLS
jgi:hypothetical protein